MGKPTTSVSPKEPRENNSEAIRIRVTPAFKAAFVQYCKDKEISEGSGGRLAIFDLVGTHARREHNVILEEPEVLPGSWKKGS